MMNGRSRLTGRFWVHTGPCRRVMGAVRRILGTVRRILGAVRRILGAVRRRFLGPGVTGNSAARKFCRCGKFS